MTPKTDSPARASNTWNDFQKVCKGHHFSSTERSVLYRAAWSGFHALCKEHRVPKPVAEMLFNERERILGRPVAFPAPRAPVVEPHVAARVAARSSLAVRMTTPRVVPANASVANTNAPAAVVCCGPAPAQAAQRPVPKPKRKPVACATVLQATTAAQSVAQAAPSTQCSAGPTSAEAAPAAAPTATAAPAAAAPASPAAARAALAAAVCAAEQSAAAAASTAVAAIAAATAAIEAAVQAVAAARAAAHVAALVRSVAPPSPAPSGTTPMPTTAPVTTTVRVTTVPGTAYATRAALPSGRPPAPAIRVALTEPRGVLPRADPGITQRNACKHVLAPRRSAPGPPLSTTTSTVVEQPPVPAAMVLQGQPRNPWNAFQQRCGGRGLRREDIRSLYWTRKRGAQSEFLNHCLERGLSAPVAHHLYGTAVPPAA